MKKKLVSLLLALCMLASLLPIPAAAQELGAPVSPEAPFLYTPPDPYVAPDSSAQALSRRAAWRDGEFTDGVYEGYYAQLDEDQQIIYNVMKKALAEPVREADLDLDRSIEIQVEEHDDWDTVYEWLYRQGGGRDALVRDHPEICWLLGSYWLIPSGNFVSEDGRTVFEMTDLRYEACTPWAPNETFDKPEVFQNAISYAVRAIGGPRSSRAAAARAINDWLCKRVVYEVRTATVPDGDTGEPVTVYYDQTAYSALVQPYKAVCLGYASAFKLLCDRYGIPCLILTGVSYDYDGKPGGAHAWNYVQLEDGKWYAVDSTWGDGTPLNYDYFLVGSSTQNHFQAAFDRLHETPPSNMSLPAAPPLSRTAYPYLEAVVDAPAAVAYGNRLAVTVSDIKGISGAAASPFWAGLYLEDFTGEPLARAYVQGRSFAFSLDTLEKRLPVGESRLLVRCLDGNMKGAVLGSCTAELAPAQVTARVDEGGSAASKPFDGSKDFSAVPLILDGVNPADAGLVTAAADGTASGADAGEYAFTANEGGITLSGEAAGFYRVAGVAGKVRIDKIEPELRVWVFPGILAPGVKASVYVRVANPEGGCPGAGQITVVGPDGVKIPVSPGGTEGEYTGSYTAAAGASGELRFTAAVSGAVNYLDSQSECTAPVSDKTFDFTDVAPGSWYEEPVVVVYHMGLMLGASDTEFSPNGTITRGMIAQILYRMEGSPDVDQPAALPFPDVRPGQWYADAAAWAGANGIVSGYSDGTFRPGAPITREQAAVMLYRSAGSPSAEGWELDFPDAFQAGGYALDALRWAVDAGILSGKAGRLDPLGRATRAEAAAMLVRYSKYVQSASR